MIIGIGDPAVYNLESSCDICRGPVLVPSGLGVDEDILCGKCASGKIEDEDWTRDLLDRAQNELEEEQKRSRGLPNEVRDLRAELLQLSRRLEEESRRPRVERPEFVVRVGASSWVIVRANEHNDRSGTLYGEVLAKRRGHKSILEEVERRRKETP